MQEKVSRLIKVLVITTVVAAGLSAQAVLADGLEFKKVYHVYLGAHHLGTVDDKEIIESYIEEQLQEQEEAQQDYHYVLTEQVSYVEETAFVTEIDDQTVIDQLDKEISFKVEATALTIADQDVGYFATHQDAEAVMQKYKELYV